MSVSHEDLHFGAAVFSSDGKEVGTLEFVLVDGEGMDLRQIVIKESPLASGHHWYQGANMLVHDVIVPADNIASADAHRVDLTLTLADMRHLPPYLSSDYRPLSSGQMVASILGGAPVWNRTETAAKPEGELEIRQGEDVMFKHSGEVLGHVHDIVYDDKELAGVVVRPRGWLTHDVLLQVRFLDRSDDGALFAHITLEDLEKLQSYRAGD